MRIPTKYFLTEDDLKEKIDLLLKNEYVSFTAIQRFFNIGYSSVGRIIDEMISLDLIVELNEKNIVRKRFNMQKLNQLEAYIYEKAKYFNIIISNWKNTNS